MWSNILGTVCLGAATLEPSASVDLLGAMLGGGASGPPGQRAAMPWNAFRAMMCNRTLSASVRLHKLRAEVVFLLVWGSVAWQLGPETIRTVVGAVVEMTRLMLHARRWEESWFDMHRRRESREHLAKAWGEGPALILGASVVGAVARLAARPACSAAHQRTRVGGTQH